jgi:zinc and cadmium transporter
MALQWCYAIASVLAVSLVSLIGLATLTVSEQKLREIIFVMVGLATGSLFGDAFIHLVPQSFRQSAKPVQTSMFILAGLLIFFILEKFLRWRHEHTLEFERHIHPVGYMNLFADTIHNCIDGMIIGASYLVSVPIGIATTLAVIAHEIPHELGNYFVLLYAGFSRRRALLFNFLSACAAILGTVIALVIGSSVKSFSLAVLPIAAGGFIYIAGSDLVPELHKETSFPKSVAQMFAMGAGIGLMLCLTLLE